MKRRDDIEGYYKYELQASSNSVGPISNRHTPATTSLIGLLLQPIAAITRDHAMQAHATISQSMVKSASSMDFIK